MAATELTEAPAECGCITAVDESLKDHNTRLAVTFMLDRGRTAMRVLPTIAVEKVEPRGKRPTTVIPTFCPFCGIRYRLQPTPTEGAHG